MANLSEPVRQLIEAPNLGHLATIMPDGSPQVTPVWVDHDGEHVLVNTAAGRQKLRNLQRNDRVAISIVDQTNPYRYASVRGEVVEMTHEGADAHIDRMAKKYLGQDTYPFRSANEQHLLVKIAPQRVSGMGLEA